MFQKAYSNDNFLLDFSLKGYPISSEKIYEIVQNSILILKEELLKDSFPDNIFINKR